jgi:hypothetical protein
MTTTKIRDDITGFIESIDPSTMRDGVHLRAISAARQQVTDSETKLVDAIRDARTAGDSWTMIGIALHTSRQNAHRKYAHLVDK